MARTRATIHTSILANTDFTDLSAGTQRVYIVILLQSRLSLAGHLDYIPVRWAHFAPDVTPDDIQTAVSELEQARFVMVDHDTAELAVRTFLAHDIGQGRLSPQVAKGVWSAWEGIVSRSLRAQIVWNAPDDVWKKLEPTAPADALQTRRSPPIDWQPSSPIDWEGQSPIDTPIDTPIDCPLPLPLPLPLPSPLTRAGVDPESEPPEPQPGDDDFQEFYDVFPRHADPGRARKAYRGALRKRGVTREMLLDAAKAYAAATVKTGTDIAYVKHPASWLNAEAWANELVTAAPAPARQPGRLPATISADGLVRDNGWNGADQWNN